VNDSAILLVEDNPSDIGLTRRALARSQITNPLIVVEDGQEALDYLFGASAHAGRGLLKQPALVLLDLNMPRVDGLTVLRRLRADPRTRRLPVVMLTSSVHERDLATSYDAGANSYIRKPVDYVQFEQAIEQLGRYWLGLNQPPPAGLE
jgi:CheY-like chemotaxis protein